MLNLASCTTRKYFLQLKYRSVLGLWLGLEPESILACMVTIQLRSSSRIIPKNANSLLQITFLNKKNVAESLWYCTQIRLFFIEFPLKACPESCDYPFTILFVCRLSRRCHCRTLQRGKPSHPARQKDSIVSTQTLLYQGCRKQATTFLVVNFQTQLLYELRIICHTQKLHKRNVKTFYKIFLYVQYFV